MTANNPYKEGTTSHALREALNKPKHTPGKWEVLDVRQNKTPVEHITIKAGAKDICHISKIASRDLLSEEDEANANLIAAAPELLKFAKSEAVYPCSTKGVEDLEGGCCRSCRARDVVAKAEGRA